VPSIDLGVAVLIGVATTSVTTYFMMRLMSVTTSLETDGEPEDVAWERHSVNRVGPWSRHMRKRR
jgi:large-conductance mechanosensitive channel